VCPSDPVFFFLFFLNIRHKTLFSGRWIFDGHFSAKFIWPDKTARFLGENQPEAVLATEERERDVLMNENRLLKPREYPV